MTGALENLNVLDEPSFLVHVKHEAAGSDPMAVASMLRILWLRRKNCDLFDFPRS
jgi:hypothetical protein